MDRIKLRITIMAVLAVFLLKGTDTFAQQTDPTLTGAVFAQTSTLKNIYNKRQKAHEKIIAAETAVTVALDRVHSVEDRMLEYLSNAQGAMQNLYQIKRAGELVATEIPQNCSLLLKSVGSNLKGTYQEYGFRKEDYRTLSVLRRQRGEDMQGLSLRKQHR